jgi:hypothetical protein
MSLENSNHMFDGLVIQNGRTPDIIEDLGSGSYYLGFFAAGGSETTESCLIVKYTVSGAITRKLYAGGSRLFNKVWNDRAGYAYSYSK